MAATGLYLCLWTFLMLHFQVHGLDVTKFPAGENVFLEPESPLILTFMVCGDIQELNGISYRVRISQNGRGADIEPSLESPLTCNDNADKYGIAVSRWAQSSSDHEQCIEIPVRVWTDNPFVMDSSIELILIKFPRVSSGGKYFLHSPATATTAAPATTTEAAAATTETTIVAPIRVPPEFAGKSLLKCDCYCE